QEECPGGRRRSTSTIGRTGEVVPLIAHSSTVATPAQISARLSKRRKKLTQVCILHFAPVHFERDAPVLVLCPGGCHRTKLLERTELSVFVTLDNPNRLLRHVVLSCAQVQYMAINGILVANLFECPPVRGKRSSRARSLAVD